MEMTRKPKLPEMLRAKGVGSQGEGANAEK